MKYLHWRENQTSTQGFRQVLTWWGGGGSSKFNGEGGLSQYLGAGGGGFPEKGKYLANICTVASKLKNVIFLLNKTLSNNIKVTAIFPTID